jgi:hypothetical protein
VGFCSIAKSQYQVKSLETETTYALDKLFSIVTNHYQSQLRACRVRLIRTMLGETNLSVTCKSASSLIQPSQLTDQPVHLLSLLRIERTPSTTHLEQQHTKGPEIDISSITLFIQQDFRGEVLGRSAERVCELVVG